MRLAVRTRPRTPPRVRGLGPRFHELTWRSARARVIETRHPGRPARFHLLWCEPDYLTAERATFPSLTTAWRHFLRTTRDHGL